MRRGRWTAAVIITAFAAGAVPAWAQEAPKPNIAIADVAVSPGGWTLPPPQMGGTIVELLVGELVGSQQFHVYDGQWLVPQQEAGGRVNLARLREAAAGRHVDYLVLGSVTAFSMVQAKNHGGALVPLRTIAGGGMYTSTRSTVAVDVSFRLVDVRTGEIITTAMAEGTGSRKATGLGLLGLARCIPLPFLMGMAHNVANARDAMLNEALQHAVHNAALELTRKQLPTEYQSSSAR